MNRGELLALAAKVEAATGPDRDLNYAILMAMGWGRDDSGYALNPRGERALTVPDYLASLDAAMTLADGFVLLHLSDIGADGLPLCKLGDPGTTPAGEWTGIAARLPLSVTAAALRARAATIGAEHE